MKGEIEMGGERFAGKTNHIAAQRDAVALVLLRVFLFMGWLRAAVEKLISADWWNGDVLRAFITDHEGSAIDGYRAFVFEVILPFPVGAAALVLIAQVLIVIGLLTQRFLRPALMLGLVLNLQFVLAGQVNPSAFYMIMELALLLSASSGELHSKALSGAPRPTWPLLVPVIVVSPLLFLARTFDPALVKDDPAMMIVFLGAITTLGLLLRRATLEVSADADLEQAEIVRTLDQPVHVPGGNRH